MLPSTTAVGVAALLLAVASTGGAVAGSLITGKQIKNGTITSADIKNGSVANKDLARSARARTGAAGAPGATGPAGPAGDRGTAGPQGPRGFSAWDVIPSGTKVTGEFRVDTVVGDFDGHQEAVALGGIASQALRADQVGFARVEGAPIFAAEVDPECQGTIADPAAPAGKVCLYLGTWKNVDVMYGGSSGYAPTQGFRIVWAPNQDVGPTATLGFAGVWAYTAP